VARPEKEGVSCRCPACQSAPLQLEEPAAGSVLERQHRPFAPSEGLIGLPAEATDPVLRSRVEGKGKVAISGRRLPKISPAPSAFVASSPLPKSIAGRVRTPANDQRRKGEGSPAKAVRVAAVNPQPGCGLAHLLQGRRRHLGVPRHAPVCGASVGSGSHEIWRGVDHPPLHLELLSQVCDRCPARRGHVQRWIESIQSLCLPCHNGLAA
jgi:hypothetical protein